MTGKIILQIVLFGLALSMDAFAISITDSLIYQDINKKRSIFIAATFGIMQAIMPLIGYWIIEFVSIIVGTKGKEEASKILSLVITWLAFILLIIVGLKMLIEAIKSIHENKKEEIKKFSIKEVLLFGVLTSIDALAVGVSLHAHTSTNTTIFLHVSIILIITFIMCLLGLFLGKFFNRLLKGKYEIACIIGGIILIALACWTITSHYLGI